ncbi:MAG: helix-turn-helix transcriptional regulator [Acidobacteria bacterium]|nr:helix-turn-helix transcriptional regulator [Acidobacteriota bacterium]
MRSDWLSRVTRELDRVARLVQTARSAEERVSAYLAGLSRLPKPSSRLEEVVLRGLLYEQTAGMGLMHACAYGRASSSCWLGVVLGALTARSASTRGHHVNDASSGTVDARLSSSLAYRAKALIDGGYGSPLTLASLASQLGCHPKTLGRQYQQVFGISVGHYIAAVRIQKALELLAQSDLKVEAISRMVGLRGKANLYRRLRRAVGLTPGQVRGLRRTPQHPAAD